MVLRSEAAWSLNVFFLQMWDLTCKMREDFMQTLAVSHAVTLEKMQVAPSMHLF